MSYLARLKAPLRVLEIIRPLRKRVYIATSQAALAGGLETIAIISLLPLLNSLSSASDRQKPAIHLLGASLDLPSWQHAFLFSLLAFFLFGLLSTLMRCYSQNNMAKLEFQIVTHVLTRTTDELLSCSWLTYQTIKSSETYKAVLLEAHRIGLGIRLFLGASAEVVVITAMTLACALISLKMTIWTLAFACLGTVGFLACGVNVQRRSSRLAQLEDNIASVLSEVFGNLKTIRLSGRKAAMARLFSDKFAQFERSAASVQRTQNLIRLLAESGALLFIVLFISIGALILQIDFAALLIFLAIFYRLIPRIISANSAYIAAGVELRHFDQWRDRLQRLEAGSPETLPQRALPFVADITIENVSFRHAGSEVDTLASISATIPKGAFVGIIGPSGSGKTTLLDIVAGLYQPTEGSILIDRRKLDESCLVEWQSSLGIVEQSSALFFGKIRDNIVWGNPVVDDTKLKNVANLAHIDGLIDRLPEKFETLVGKGGAALSGGEIQRISLARALYRDPQVLLLDEATSALDLEAEAKVLEAIESVRGRCTIIMVSHRLQTVRHCDFILVLEQGKLIESGTWNELTAKPQGALQRMLLQGASGTPTLQRHGQDS